MDQTNIKVPAILIDLDGVLWREDKGIEAAGIGLKNLTANLKDVVPQFSDTFDNEAQLPFAFVTNAGSCPQSVKSDKILKYFPYARVCPSDIVLNHTPLIQELEKFKEDILLIAGSTNVSENLYVGLEQLGITKYITCDEYAKIYPQLWYNPVCPDDERLTLLKTLSDRLGITITTQEFVRVGALVFLGDFQHFEQVAQITCDVLSTENGVPSLFPTNIAPASHIPVYTVLPDKFYTSKQGILRLGFGSFFEAIENFYRLYFNTDMKVNKYGKPSMQTALYSKNLVDIKAKQFNSSISNYYVIGDNPQTDIRMANVMGWKSVLVETGVYQAGSEISDELNRPTYIAKNFGEAIKIIFEKEGLNFVE